MPIKVTSRYVEDRKIRSLRVRTWFRAVAQASGLTASQLEREFREESTERTPCSCIWNKYQRGEVVPRSGRHGNGRPNLVERVEARYPETAKWLFSPLWRLLDRAPIEMSEIRRIYEEMPKPIRSIFVASDIEATHIFWRRPVDPEHVCDILLRFGDLDALVALLIMVKEGEVTQDRYQYSVALNAVKQKLQLLAHQQQCDILNFADFIRYFLSAWRC